MSRLIAGASPSCSPRTILKIISYPAKFVNTSVADKNESILLTTQARVRLIMLCEKIICMDPKLRCILLLREIDMAKNHTQTSCCIIVMNNLGSLFDHHHAETSNTEPSLASKIH